MREMSEKHQPNHTDSMIKNKARCCQSDWQTAGFLTVKAGSQNSRQQRGPAVNQRKHMRGTSRGTFLWKDFGICLKSEWTLTLENTQRLMGRKQLSGASPELCCMCCALSPVLTTGCFLVYPHTAPRTAVATSKTRSRLSEQLRVTACSMRPSGPSGAAAGSPRGRGRHGEQRRARSRARASTRPGAEAAPPTPRGDSLQAVLGGTAALLPAHLLEDLRRERRCRDPVPSAARPPRTAPNPDPPGAAPCRAPPAP